MSENPTGKIGWLDLTVDQAESIRDFYQQVVGWKSEDVSMGDYSDFNMTSNGEAVAGICHARGANANQPAQWMVYITVADLDQSTATCIEMGGQILVPAREAGGGRFAVIQDPAGACMALWES